MPQPVTRVAVVPRKDLEALEKQLKEQAKDALQRQQEKGALDSELQAVRAQLAEAKAAAEKKPDTHDYTEAQTRHYLIGLEDLRLRGLVQFIDKSKRKIVYTHFEDEITGVREDASVYMPKMTGNQYAKKVEDYLHSHQDEISIQRLRNNQPLTLTDLLIA